MRSIDLLLRRQRNPFSSLRIFLLLLVSCFQPRGSSSYVPPPQLSLSFRRSAWFPTLGAATEQDDDDDWDSVSDAEALLACWSYWQKRHPLADGWRQRRRSSNDPMFFWEPPSALRYFQPPRRANATTALKEDATTSLQPIPGTRYFVQTAARVAEDDDEREEEDDEEDDSVVAQVALLTLPSTPSASASSIEDVAPDMADSVWDLDDDPFAEDATTSTTTTVFSSTLSLHRLYNDDETTAVLRHQRRSQAARQRFDNATWKAEWYQRRWGDRKRRPNKLAPARMDQRARRQIPATFLAQLAVLSEAELAAALRQYRQANRRRSRHRLRTNARRRQFLTTLPTTTKFHYHDDDEDDDPQTASDEASRPKTTKVFSSFLVPTSPQPNPALQAERERRAAQAQRAYQRRVPPKASYISPLLTTTLQHPGRTRTPAEALRMTEQLLWQHAATLYQSPELLSKLRQLVPIVLVPTKLAQRRAILCRVVQQVWGLRGKCIPAEDGTTYQFLTKASVPALGAFLMERIRQRLQELAANPSDPVK